MFSISQTIIYLYVASATPENVCINRFTNDQTMTMTGLGWNVQNDGGIWEKRSVRCSSHSVITWLFSDHKQIFFLAVFLSSSCGWIFLKYKKSADLFGHPILSACVKCRQKDDKTLGTMQHLETTLLVFLGFGFVYKAVNLKRTSHP